MMPVEPGDMAFADFGTGATEGSAVAKRRYPSPSQNGPESGHSDDAVTPRNGRGIMERETGFEPATLSLGM